MRLLKPRKQPKPPREQKKTLNKNRQRAILRALPVRRSQVGATEQLPGCGGTSGAGVGRRRRANLHAGVPEGGSLPSKRGAVGDTGAEEFASRMVRQHIVTNGRDAAPSVSDFLRVPQHSTPSQIRFSH